MDSKTNGAPAESAAAQSKGGRKVPMEVLVLGLCRTGTMSIRAALKDLGYQDTYHMKSAIAENIADCELWKKALAAKFDDDGEFTKDDWDDLLGNCMAVTDVPCAAFGPELIAAYPDAKVIMTNRDIDSWYRSVMQTIQVSRDSWGQWFWSFLVSDVRRTYTMTNMMWDRIFDGDFRKNGKSYYKSHGEEIRCIMASRPNDLLEYEVKQGWAPLCEFLDKPIPKHGFPSVNSTPEFLKMRQGMMWKQVKSLTTGALPIFAGLGLMCAVVFKTVG